MEWLEMEAPTITVSCEAQLDITNKVPLRDIVTQHRKRWVLHTHIGDIVLKRISKLDLEAITIDLITNVPGYHELITEAAKYSFLSKLDDGIDAEGMTRYFEVCKKLSVHNARYQLACFVDPIPEDADTLLALCEALNDDEYSQLSMLLELLANPNPGDVNVSGIMLAQEYNVPLTDDLTLENMTAQQESAFRQASERVAKDIKGML